MPVVVRPRGHGSQRRPGTPRSSAPISRLPRCAQAHAGLGRLDASARPPPHNAPFRGCGKWRPPADATRRDLESTAAPAVTGRASSLAGPATSGRPRPGDAGGVTFLPRSSVRALRAPS
jgi:hypothetical protein